MQEYVRNQDGTPTSFRRFPWQRHMLESKAPHNLACKGAQLGISHVVLCRGMHANDVERRDVLYVLPSMHPHGSDFSTARFDSITKSSPHLAQLYSGSNVGHKRTPTNNFYIRGAQSRTGGKSVPAGVLVLDEIDEIPTDFIPLVRERMSGQIDKLEWDISTPTIPDYGIDKLWSESSQERFFFPCPSCTRLIDLTYPECLEVVGDDPDSTKVLKESYLKCPLCQVKIPHEAKPALFAKAEFVPTIQGKEKRGFHVNQLYSSTVTPGEVAAASIRAQLNEVDEQEFWNSKMGKAHAPKGSKLTANLINACRSTHLNGSAPYHPIVTMGVDVGSWLHFEVCEWDVGPSAGNDVNSNSTPRILSTGKCKDFEQLDTMMLQYRIAMCVIDALPETRKAFEFSQRFWGFVKMCYYAQGVQGRMLLEGKWDNGEPIINVNRTSWMDAALGRVKAQRIVFPIDLPHEYVEHLQVPSRIWVRNKDGNPVATWKTPDGKADHHAHARTYAEVALPLAMGLSASYDVGSPLDE